MPNTQVRILPKPKSSARSPCSIEKTERGREKIYKSADDVWAFLLFLAISTEVDELVAAAAAAPERNDDDGTGGRGSGGYITDALLEEQKKKKDLS